MGKTIVLLDVDGVINWWVPWAARDDEELKEHWRSLTFVENLNSPYLLRAPVTVGPIVRKLVADHEVWWCTAWRHMANDFVSPLLDIPELPVIVDERSARGADWKLAEVVSMLTMLVDEERHVVWIEDFATSWLDPYALDALDQSAVHLIDTSEYGYLREEDLADLYEQGIL